MNEKNRRRCQRLPPLLLYRRLLRLGTSLELLWATVVMLIVVCFVVFSVCRARARAVSSEQRKPSFHSVSSRLAIINQVTLQAIGSKVEGYRITDRCLALPAAAVAATEPRGVGSWCWRDFFVIAISSSRSSWTVFRVICAYEKTIVNWLWHQ